MAFFAAPPSIVTVSAIGYPFHIFPSKKRWAKPSMWVVPAPWMHA